jgi:hypothetical protein
MPCNIPTLPGSSAGLRAWPARLTVLVGLLWLLLPGAGYAEVTRIEIATREPVLGGRSFGDVGAYEKLRGTVYFAVDPTNPRNRIIADIDLAPRNAQGLVEFSSDIFIIRPIDPTRGNGVLFFDMVNRGNSRLLSVFSRAQASHDPTTEAEYGDAWLLEQGYTLVSGGWQFDIDLGPGLVGMDAPVATLNGETITGWVSMWFVTDEPTASYDYTLRYNTPAYPPMDLDDPNYRLTVREGVFAQGRLIPREDWRFAREEQGQVVADYRSIWLRGGLEPGKTYEIHFETSNPPVAGLGFAAIRDVASHLKHAPDAIAPGQYAYIYGSSQTGRGIRHFIWEGFTIDQQERIAFDGAFINTGGASLGRFNERFAQPNELGNFNATWFPIHYRVTVDPVTGRSDGLGARIPQGLEPKVFMLDTSSEYWDRGRVAALRHTSIDGTEDLDDAPNVRAYLYAGTRHGAGTVPPGYNIGQFRSNPNDYRWGGRALLVSLDAWVREGREPPPSRHPRLADGTLTLLRDYAFPEIPGVQWPVFAPGGYRTDVPAPHSPLPLLVSQVDADGNEVGGIRFPIQAVPLATITGWQFRAERVGAPNVLVSMDGAYIPFPLTRAERESTDDPRLSIEERYAGRADYLARIEEVGNRLAQERLLLTRDIPLIVEEAGVHWDWLMELGKSSARDDR